MAYVDDMAIALRLAKAWMPKTPHGEIVVKRIGLAIAAYEREHPQPAAEQARIPVFRNRLMQ